MSSHHSSRGKISERQWKLGGHLVRSIARHLDEDQLVSRLLRVLLLIPTSRHLHLEQHRAQKDWTAAEWKVVFCEESRFSLDSD
ncbi:hypothetical protein TNCV_2091811 [Trichonephila clavipes]|nr:hypothetical protein TNCV_2091811 [Trichonephila clavipes]